MTLADRLGAARGVRQRRVHLLETTEELVKRLIIGKGPEEGRLHRGGSVVGARVRGSVAAAAPAASGDAGAEAGLRAQAH